MKSESESHLVVSDSLWPHGLYSLPGSSVHGIIQARILEWVAITYSKGIFPTQGSNPGPLHYRWILFHLSHQGSPRTLEWVAYPFSRDLPAKNQTGISCIAEGFPTRRSIRKALTIVKFSCQSGRLGNLYKNYKHFFISSSPQNKKSVANLIDVGMGGRFSCSKAERNESFMLLHNLGFIWMYVLLLFQSIWKKSCFPVSFEVTIQSYCVLLNKVKTDKHTLPN